MCPSFIVGTTFPMTTPGHVPTGGVRMDSLGLLTGNVGCASHWLFGMRRTLYSRRGFLDLLDLRVTNLVDKMQMERQTAR